MNARKRHIAIAGVIVLSTALVSCGGLPRSLRDEIASEHDRLQQADRQLQHTRDTVKEDLAKKPDLFNGSGAATEWPAKLRSAQDQLDRAKRDDQELVKLSRTSGEDARRRAERLVREERTLREAALRDSDYLSAEAARWLDFERNAPHYLTKMQTEYDQIKAVDLNPVVSVVQKAEQDWPAKKADLEARLASLREASANAASLWQSSEAARREAASGKTTGAAVATLIQTDEALSKDAAALTTGADQLRAQSGQLYDAWDKILTDLDKSRAGPNPLYREKLKTVKTHFVDVAAKKTEVSNNEEWVDVSPGAYRAVENDLGMVIAHKDAGHFDSEATTTAQPPGFAYVASPEQGSNQYGYWSHAGGQSVWTFLPEYFLMRELLWGRNYQPIYINEYHGYQNAQRYGRSYYGNESPAAPPKYGSHGTFTEQRYSGSRYVQSGGFKGSSYSSREAESPRTSPGFSRPQTQPGESSAGKRFGGGSSASPGRRFGSPGGGGGPRMPARSFGRRR